MTIRVESWDSCGSRPRETRTLTHWVPGTTHVAMPQSPWPCRVTEVTRTPSGKTVVRVASGYTGGRGGDA
jgi:hypothetical protein